MVHVGWTLALCQKYVESNLMHRARVDCIISFLESNVPSKAHRPANADCQSFTTVATPQLRRA